MLKIYIVDDEPNQLLLLTTILKNKLKCDVKCFQDAGHLLNEINLEVPQLILSDIMMPKMTGLEMVDTLRTKDQTKSVPVIFISATIEYPEEKESIYYIPKPYDIDKLITTIKTCINQ